MAVKRLAILFVAALLAVAAPARAWCEAACLAPAAHAAKPHCPSHEHQSDAAAIAASDGADCPVLDSARPVVARVDLATPATLATSVPARSARPPQRSQLPRHPGAARPFELFTPLRL